MRPMLRDPNIERRMKMSPDIVAARTSDRAGRARAPTHAHPVFDNKVPTPTHPAHRQKTKFGVGARSPLKRHPVARSPVRLEAGVPTSGAP